MRTWDARRGFFCTVCVLGVLLPSWAWQKQGKGEWSLGADMATHKRKQEWGDCLSFLRGPSGWCPVLNREMLVLVRGKSEWAAILRCSHLSPWKCRWEKPHRGAPPKNSSVTSERGHFECLSRPENSDTGSSQDCHTSKRFLLPLPHLPPSTLTWEECAISLRKLGGAGWGKEENHWLLS